MVAEEVSDLANRESQCEELFDSLQIGIKFAFLKSPLRFSKRFALLLFGGQGLFCSQANQIALQLREEREEGDHDFRAHIMLGHIQVLLEDDHPDIACDPSEEFPKMPKPCQSYALC